MACKEVILMKSVFLPLSALSVAVLLSCGTGKNTVSQTGREQVENNSTFVALADTKAVENMKGNSRDTDQKKNLPEQLPLECLELCYATSINMPEELYGPENVFDGDNSTYWATMPGAAPDEGLYFSFEEPIEIESIIIEAVPGSSEFEEIEYIQLYINGIEGARRDPEYPFYSYGQVKSVFIKIIETESMYGDERGIRYQKDLPVAISEIRIMVINDEGTEVPLQVMPIAEVDGSVEASSSLEPVEAYGPDFLFDSKPAFGWADGNENSTGAGENLTFHFDESQHIERLLIWNGYHRSRTHFDHNERASLISFGVEGETPVEYRLDDTMTPQVVYLDSSLDGSSFKLDFLEIYPGEVYRDLVVSELRFFDGNEWFVIDTGGGEERKLEILEWARNCDSAIFIDRQISSHIFIPEGNEYRVQSLVIRSNGSFVLWKNFDIPGATDERMYADGNWQILDDNTIRIFGRLHRLADYGQNSYDPYAGTWSDQEERLDRMTIFSDTLRFGSDWMSSSRGMFEDLAF